MPPTFEPSDVERAHINQALKASDTALSAIDTLLNMSMWTLGILAILLAAIGIVGWSVIRSACLERSEKIANTRLDAYIDSQEFSSLVKAKVEQAVRSEWQDAMVRKLTEAVRKSDDPSPFEEKKD